MTYHRDRPDHRAACEGKAALFESTDAADHQAARMLCNTCPVRDACLQLARDEAANGAPEGTWAGKLFVGRFARPSAEAEFCKDCLKPMVRTKTGRTPEGVVRHCGLGRCTGCAKVFRGHTSGRAEAIAARIEAEDMAWNADEARIASGRYAAGHRDPWTVEGRRVYERWHKRQRRAEGAAA